MVVTVQVCGEKCLEVSSRDQAVSMLPGACKAEQLVPLVLEMSSLQPAVCRSNRVHSSVL